MKAPGSPIGYPRSKLHTWDTGANHCDTRETVLMRDGSKETVDRLCHVTGGMRTSSYDGLVFRDASKLDIDHVVPLENA
jgi:hypothetical protein